ncbi:MAG TPA: biotin--[acetyl-CoA-carboxylase] ligase [Dehalococcoidia bacterium]|nr:biotin--[acetyl-CoA-carboxylase] ligase [Dehalococcoidia bacterium]
MPKGAIADDSVLARVAAHLKARRGVHVSGEELARALGLSRNAVWRHVASLRRLGYDVRSSPRLGHRLLAAPDRPLPWEVAEGLATCRLGRPLRYLEVAGSTQDTARRWAEAGAPEGATVVAEEQRLGRGRRGQAFLAPRGGLWFSLVLRPQRPPSQALLLSLMATVAVSRAIAATTGLACVLSWPKDVLLGGRKVAGVLVEVEAEPDWVRHAVLGIGVNVNLAQASLPPALAPSVTSLRQELGRPVPLVPLLRRLLQELDGLYDLYLREGPAPLVDAWRQAPSILGRRVEVDDGDTGAAGEAVDLGPDGSLLVQASDGRLLRFISGHVRPAPLPADTSTNGG